MNTIRLLALGFSFCLTTSAFPQGSLTPPAGPTPTMKTLAQIEPRTPIPGGTSGFTITVSGSYYLTGNLVIASGNGITVNASNVTLDLGGFEIAGTGGSNGVLVGGGQSNVTIRNGTLHDFTNRGISTVGNSRVRVEKVRAILNGNVGISVGDEGAVVDCLVQGSSATGITAGNNCLVRNCQSIGNTGAGSNGLTLGNGVQVSGCVTNNNAGEGINTGDRGVFDSCTSSGNSGRGFNALSYATFVNCTASGNGASGIEGFDHITVSASNCSNNNADGVFIDSGTITDTTADANGLQGIENFGNLPLNVVHCSVNDNANLGVQNDGPGRIEGCTIRGNIGGGIEVESKVFILNNSCEGNGAGTSAIRATGSGNRIEGNNVTNHNKGIEVTAASNLIIRNSASGNTMNYDIAGSNSFGPIVTTANIGSSNSPHANYDF